MSTDNDKMGTLRHQLSTLDELFKEVAIQYEAAAATLREGLLPDRTPGFQLDAARKVFTDTLSVLSDVGDAYGLAPVSQNASLPSAQSYLNTVQEAKEELERQLKLLSDAHMVLSEAKLITHTQDAEGMGHLQEAIIHSTSQLDASDLEEAQQLVDGSHVISKLIAYTSHRDSLSDEEYDSFRDSIEASFGRPTLRDIDRGRIMFASFEEDGERTDSIFEEVQEDTQNEIIDIVDESDDDFPESVMNGAFYEEHDEMTEESDESESDESDFEESESDESDSNEESELFEATETSKGTEFFEETMHDEHEPFWPPSLGEEESSVEETLNGEFEIDEDFNPEEDTITGRLS